MSERFGSRDSVWCFQTRNGISRLSGGRRPVEWCSFLVDVSRNSNEKYVSNLKEHGRKSEQVVGETPLHLLDLLKNLSSNSHATCFSYILKSISSKMWKPLLSFDIWSKETTTYLSCLFWKRKGTFRKQSISIDTGGTQSTHELANSSTIWMESPSLPQARLTTTRKRKLSEIFCQKNWQLNILSAVWNE